MIQTKYMPKLQGRTDLLALWGGILFSLAFSALIWWAGGRLDSIELLPDTGASYDRLPGSTDSSWSDWIRVVAGAPDQELENT